MLSVKSQFEDKADFLYVQKGENNQKLFDEFGYELVPVVRIYAAKNLVFEKMNPEHSEVYVKLIELLDR